MKLVFALLLVLAACASTQALVAQPHLFSLSVLEGSTIRLSFFNPSNLPHSLVVKQTPFEGDLFGNYFVVTDSNGQRIPYQGKMARRITTIVPEDITIVHSKNELSIEIDLAPHYAFPEPGQYTVLYVPRDSNYAPSSPVVIDVQRIVTEPWLEQDFYHRAVSDVASTDNAALSWPGLGSTKNCDSSDRSIVSTNVPIAISESKNAYQCMDANSCSSTETKWFGGSTWHDFDDTCFHEIYSHLTTSVFNCYCNPPGCSSNTYAYVYPTDPTFTVYLCGAFWSQANERVNTLVHEVSHFNVLCGSEDYQYGRVGCLNLASKSSFQASHNADNICYFAEDVSN